LIIEGLLQGGYYSLYDEVVELLEATQVRAAYIVSFNIDNIASCKWIYEVFNEGMIMISDIAFLIHKGHTELALWMIDYVIGPHHLLCHSAMYKRLVIGAVIKRRDLIIFNALKKYQSP
jgi:hypothetical protein